MTITIDATPLLMRSAGVKGYLHHWIRALLAAAPPGMFQTFPRIDDLGQLDHERSPLSKTRTLAWLAAIGVTQRAGIGLAARHRTDVFHCSNQIRRIPRRCRVTATIHDMTSWLMPQINTAANVRADLDFAQHVLIRADAVIAVSENTRRDAIRHLGLSPQQVVTIHSGVAPEYFDVIDEDVQRAQQALGLQKPYVLCVGTVEPRKNVKRLLDAWELLPRDIRATHELVFAGPRGWKNDAIMNRILSTACARYLGYVPEEHLPGLTRGAALLSYVSLYEGFGFPVAQAMAAGTAVLTSETSCLPEIADGAARLVNPLSAADTAKALRELLESPATRQEMIAKGRTVAQRYRWERCAAESLAFFQRFSD